jgi:hypothetical protein
MKLRSLGLGLALFTFATGCAVQHDTTSPDPTPAARLPSDAYFTQLMSPCGAPAGEPADCVMALAFCASGIDQYKLGDVVSLGEYTLDEAVVVDSVQDLTFDLSTSLLDGDSQPWTAVQAAPDDVECEPLVVPG